MLKDKIKSPAALRLITTALKRKGKKIVFTNGCFDLIHYGHVMYLEQAKKQGDILVVGVNSDASVRRIKDKGRPIVGQHDRAAVLAALECVNYVVIFGQDTPRTLIESLVPDVLIKGSDWKTGTIVGADFVKDHGGRVATVPLAQGRSTTDLIRKIAQIY